MLYSIPMGASFDKTRSDFPAFSDFVEAVKEHCAHQFDVDPVEFQKTWSVTVEYAAQHNDSWTGQSGFHACTDRPCADPVDIMFANVKGRECFCDCHSWNKT